MARQALRSNPNAWQQARPRAMAVREARPARPGFGTLLQRMLQRGEACNTWVLLGSALLAWLAALLVVAWLLEVFP